VATDGELALRIVALDPKPDLILLDVMLPGISGYEVLAALRANPSTRQIPVIFATGLAQAGDEVKGLELGAAD
jgi:putative two-component system response regulator